tara:strand:+ start:1422 stop:2504 length:1083 start_codon:yes stop_codon:yes gene_type:complete
MKFFNLDLHISVIADIKSIFNDLGHQIDDWTLSGHAWAFGRQRDRVEVINHTNWKDIDQNICNAFYKRYKDELSQYDGFICTYAPSFSLLFEKFNKPIIMISPIRYEAPFWNDSKKWNWYNNFLKEKIDSGQIIPVANNKFDKQYCEMFTGKVWQHIPSLCEYTKAPYNPERENYIYSSLLPVETMGYDNLIIPKNRALPQGYDWKDLSKFKGIVHIPYCPSTMSIFENYTSSIPMFFPSYKFMLMLRDAYGKNGVLNQMSWREVNNLKPGSIIPFDNKAGTITDINNYGNINDEKEWIKLSDFYDEEWMPFIQYFDSFSDLKYLLRTTNTQEISDNMKSFNELRKEIVYKSWKEILENI